jgi:hypothetical protein
MDVAITKVNHFDSSNVHSVYMYIQNLNEYIKKLTRERALFFLKLELLN